MQLFEMDGWFYTEDEVALALRERIALAQAYRDEGFDVPPVHWIPRAPIHGACGRVMRPRLSDYRWACLACKFSVSMTDAEKLALAPEGTMVPVDDVHTAETRPIPGDSQWADQPLVKCGKCGVALAPADERWTCRRCTKAFCWFCAHDNDGMKLVGCPNNPKCRMEWAAKRHAEYVLPPWPVGEKSCLKPLLKTLNDRLNMYAYGPNETVGEALGDLSTEIDRVDKLLENQK